ncbi:MAG: ATP-dependent DNA helicase RecG [Pseudomonadota bacterium]
MSQGKSPGELDDPLTALKGVGPKVAEKLARLGLEQVSDLLFHLPLRYEDRTRIWPLGELRPGQLAQVEGEVINSRIVWGRKPMLLWTLGDGSGRLTMRLFNFFRSQLNQLKTGTAFRCYGEVRAGQRGLEMIHPEYRRVDECGPLATALTPHYPSGDGVSQKLLRKLVPEALKRLDEVSLAPLPAEVVGGAPVDAGASLNEALRYVHQPPPEADVEALAEGAHPLQQALAFQELLAHRLSLRLRRESERSRSAPVMAADSGLRDQLVQSLPFTLTGAQQRVIREIGADLAQPRPTLRLLQGDVGSGKTVVAAAAAAQAIDAGHQVALAAPTELLSEQHFSGLKALLEPLSVKVIWLTGRLRGKQRTEALESVSGDADLIVGTHALMQAGVEYRQLGLVVIDEQHRFGVDQRMALRAKGGGVDNSPHQLIMTATPIPRTLAMTAYADLDISTIDELPPGRIPITTVAMSNSKRDVLIERVRAACAGGQRVYWVCTIIEESEALQAEAASDLAESLTSALPDLAVGLIHGRLKAAEKDAVMGEFKDGQLQVLVATTVIEVGVDVPEATLMIIENAERLGLSQLHQLRGRVGRGGDASSCVLLYQPPLSSMARQRLNVMRETNDGFEIARKDLELRGPGEVLGTRQTGEAQFRIADLSRDRALLPSVGQGADRMLEAWPEHAQELVDRWIGRASEYADV